MIVAACKNKDRLLGRTTTVLTSAGTTTFSYDFESRATSITGPGISQTNVYNGLDTRIGSTTNSVAQTYLRDGAYVTDPVLKDSSATYTPGVSERRGTATTFLHSGLKNADTQTGTAQTVSATRRYDAFGNVVTSTGIWNGPFGYAGGIGYQEDATGLKLLGHRYYDSSTGRFLTRDPIKDGRNWFVYCDNDPLVWMDLGGTVRQTVLYKLVNTVTGTLAKWGITFNPGRRYSGKYLRENNLKLEVIAEYEDRTHALADERDLTEVMPGYMNREPWAESRLALALVPSMQIDENLPASGIHRPGTGFKALGAFLFALLTLDPFGVGTEFGKVIDPVVRDTNRGLNFLSRNRWLDSEDAVL